MFDQHEPSITSFIEQLMFHFNFRHIIIFGTGGNGSLSLSIWHFGRLGVPWKGRCIYTETKISG